jgi:hypothetical protein
MISIISTITVFASLNIHSHKLESGKIVVHSHNYDKSQNSENSHNHTEKEILQIELFKLLFFGLIFILGAIKLPKTFVFSGFFNSKNLVYFSSAIKLRGPPQAFILK